MGWTRANAPKCNAISWNTNPRIMLATPRSHTGWRARRNTSQTSKAAVSLLLAPLRWHTEAVAVHKLAAMASRIAFSISTAFTSSAVSQPAWPWRAAEPVQPGSATAGQPTRPRAYSGWNSVAHPRNSPCQGCRAAGERAVMNIRWVQGLAEDLPAVPGSQTGQPDRAARPGSQIGRSVRIGRSPHPDRVMERITIHGVMILRACTERAGSGPGITGGGVPPWSWASR